jgi:hypothetical protein
MRARTGFLIFALCAAFGWGFQLAAAYFVAARAARDLHTEQLAINEAFLQRVDPGARGLAACIAESQRLGRDLTGDEIHVILNRVHGVKGGAK